MLVAKKPGDLVAAGYSYYTELSCSVRIATLISHPEENRRFQLRHYWY